MTAAAQKIYAAADRYIDAMNSAGKTPTTLHVTKRQHETVCTHLTKEGGGEKEVKRWTDYRGLQVKVVAN